MPVRLAREYMLFLPAAGRNDEAQAGEGYAAVGGGKRADTVSGKVGVR